MTSEPTNNRSRKRLIIGGVIILLVLALAYPLLLAVIQLASPVPATVGNGQLVSCPETPNCVSSLAEDTEFYIAPLQYDTSDELAQEVLEQTLADLPRTTIMQVEDGYIHAVSRSPTMRFIDDMEFVFDSATQQINVRAAARLGYSDMGANRSRVETLRDRFTNNLLNAQR